MKNIENKPFNRNSRPIYMKDKINEKVEISVNLYNNLIEAYNLLECLRSCGLEKWSGYSEAVDMLEKLEENEYVR